MYAHLCFASVAIMLLNSNALLVAVLRISYGKFTWALVWRLVVAVSAAATLRLSCEQWIVLPTAFQKAFVPLAVLLSLSIPFLVVAVLGQRKG